MAGLCQAGSIWWRGSERTDAAAGDLAPSVWDKSRTGAADAGRVEVP